MTSARPTTGGVSAASPFRTEIERALDEMVPYEEGMRFQALAVILAKKKWPDLVACERKKDLGLDAYSSASLAPDGKGKVLACSISATLEKIEGDAKKVKERYPDTKVIIFATPVKVTNLTGLEWTKEVQKTFGFELVLMPREEIVTSLMDPANAPLCRTLLGMALPIPVSESRPLEDAREASREVTAAWLAHPRLSGKPRIALQATKLDQSGRETDEVQSLGELQHLLNEGRRLVLEGPAGRGKTTTLVEIARQRNDNDQLALLVDLPEWVASRQDILDFVARMPQYRARGVQADTLARLSRVEHLSFLLNGWNEISDAYSEEAMRALAQLERDFPAAGIIVATRTHHLVPPLPGASRMRLLSLSRAQRADYLRASLSSRGDELRLQLEGNRTLDALTRTPLILSEVTTLFQSGLPIPETRTGILDAVMRLMEGATEHRDYLQRPPIAGRARAYLEALAMQMTSEADVRLSDEDARTVCLTVSNSLLESRQIATLPDPSTTLGTLCAHHVLERLDHPAPAYRFEHQQFQEFYASAALRRKLQVAGDHPASAREFAAQYVNLPFWEEPLCMIAEEIAAQASSLAPQPDASRLGNRLVEMTLPIDPIFAGELARLCGPGTSPEVRALLVAQLRAWYAVSDEHHRQCAIAGMLASGLPDFSDLLVPLLTSDDQQVRLRTYRVGAEFHLSSLGPDWRGVVSRWGEDQRADFIHEAMRKRWSSDLGEGFALSDPSPPVRSSALEALHWYGAEDSLATYLNTLSDDDFDSSLGVLRGEGVPRALWPRATACFRKRLQSAAEPAARLRLLLAVHAWGDTAAGSDIRSELEHFPTGRVDDHTEMLLQSAMDKISAERPEWACEWTTARIVDGSLWRDQWLRFLTAVPRPLQDEILGRFGSEDLQHLRTHRLADILIHANDPTVIDAAVGRLVEIRQKIASEPGQRHVLEWKLLHQLQGLVRAFPPETQIAGLLSRVRGHTAQSEYTVAIDLLGTIGPDAPDLRGSVPVALRQEIRGYLLSVLPSVLGEEDFSGHLKMQLAVALGRVGDVVDMIQLERLVQADIARLRAARAALLRGDRSQMANGARMGCANWHVHAIIDLDERSADEVLLRLLGEPEYEGEAGKGLIRLARTTSDQGWAAHKSPDYRAMWEARAGHYVAELDVVRSQRYAAAISHRTDAIESERQGSDKPDSFNRRLKTLAATLVRLDGRSLSVRILEIMALPLEWDGWNRADALETLLFNGVALPTEATLNVLNPTIEHIQKYGIHSEQNLELLKKCLCLLPFVEEPEAGIRRVDEILSSANIWNYALREVVIALGNSRCDAALPLLRRFATTDPSRPALIASELIEALAALDTNGAREMLLGFVDPASAEPGLNLHMDFHDGEKLASSLAALARREPTVAEQLCRLCEANLPQQNRALLAKVVTRLRTPAAILASLNLLSDATVPAIPSDFVRGIESIFVQQRPLYGNLYVNEPVRADETRERLFGMVLNDARRRKSAFSVLGLIEVWRLDYGRPNTEPRHPAIDAGVPWPPLDAMQSQH